ncbi:MAG: ATPase domain-containing protein [bacterium]|jgi:DNA repair protein RadA/Sms
MKKRKISYICSECGYISKYWLGKCPNCQNWDTFVENNVDEQDDKNKLINNTEINVKNINEIIINENICYPTNISEVDRCLGGGFFKKSLVLLSGEPGVGKSTLTLQIANNLPLKVIYVAAEESAIHIKSRFDRINKNNINNNLFIFENSNLGYILEAIKDFDFIIIDSIQAIFDESLNTPIGSTSQVKSCIDKIITYLKINDKIFLILAHITKSGLIAGPKFLEHMVDTTLFLENKDEYRILRVKKNRYGSTQEIGLFTMTPYGLIENNISIEFKLDNPGSVYFFLLEGSRLIPLEIQSLVSKAYFEKPKRIAWGLDPVKLSVIISIIQKFLRFDLYKYDVISSVVGALKIFDPLADFSIAASIISSYLNTNFSKSLFIGNLNLYSYITPINSSLFTNIILQAFRYNIENIYSNYNKDEVYEILKNNISNINDINKIIEKINFIKIQKLEDLLKII